MQLESAPEIQVLEERLVTEKGRARAKPSVQRTLIGYTLLSPPLTCSLWLRDPRSLASSFCFWRGCCWLPPTLARVSWSWSTSVVCPSACGPGHPTQALVLSDSLGNEKQRHTKSLKTIHWEGIFFLINKNISITKDPIV